MAWSRRLTPHRSICLFGLLAPLALGACGDDGREETDAGSSTAVLTTPTSTLGTTDGGSTDGTTAEPTGATESTDGTGTSDSDTAITTTPTTDPNDPTTDPSTDSDSDSDSTDSLCPNGTIVCDGGEAKVCDGMGGFSSTEVCPEECAPDLGCVLCIPGQASCEGEYSNVCNPAGDGFDPVHCDPVQGVSCNMGSGYCEGACSPQSIGLSYIGCDYYPTVTQQLDAYVPSSQYAVAVANTTADPANVTITRGANVVNNTVVQPSSVAVIVLPWVDELALGEGPSKVAVDGAYRLRSDRPVTVYQYNPLAANVTNDASLMLPVNAWTGNYVVAAWPFWQAYPGFYSVTASEDQTLVTITAPPSGALIQAGGGLQADGNGQVMLDQGDVLQVVTANGANDVTGTLISADKPIEVLGGHDCTQVPIGIAACDHLEESMFPIETLSKEYIVVPPVQVPSDNLEKAQVIRVVATADNTTLTFEPDQGVNTNLALAGSFVEIPYTINKFKVSANNKILVAQYMVGQQANFGTSDPAMLVAVATEQYRTNYLFHAPVGWTGNYVDIIAPNGANVTVDGVMVGAFQSIAGTNFSVAHVKLSNAGDGTHNVSSNQKIGISVYGVLNYGSYWYPGGLDLQLIPQ